MSYDENNFLKESYYLSKYKVNFSVVNTRES